jgi:hypothetical protein
MCVLAAESDPSLFDWQQCMTGVLAGVHVRSHSCSTALPWCVYTGAVCLGVCGGFGVCCVIGQACGRACLGVHLARAESMPDTG